MDRETVPEGTVASDCKDDSSAVGSITSKAVEALNGDGELFVSGETSTQALAMEEAFENLVSVRRGLDVGTDKLNRHIEEFEQRLLASNPGISAWVELEPLNESSEDAVTTGLHAAAAEAAGESGYSRPATMLGFIRVGGAKGWQLVIASVGGVPRRLLRTPRRTRVEATKRFRDLLNQIVKRSTEVLEDVETATKRLQAEL